MPANERFHTLAFSASADQAALAQLPMIPDAMTNTQNGNLVVPDWNLIGAIYANGAELNEVRLNAPSLQGLWLPDVYPFDASDTPSYPTRIWDVVQSPLRLVPNEQLEIDTSEGGAGANQMNVFVWLFPRRPTPITGDIRTIKATSATTLTAFTWTNCPLTLSAQLPAGRYALVGLACIGASPIVARVAFVGGVYRPGVVASVTLGDDSYYAFRQGNMGVFGEFDHNLVPSIDVFAGAADSAQTFFLDLMKIG